MGCYLCNSKFSRGHLDHTLAYTRQIGGSLVSTQEIGSLAGLASTICETCPEEDLEETQDKTILPYLWNYDCL